MSKQQDTILFKIDEIHIPFKIDERYIVEIQNSKIILEVVENLHIPNPNILEILSIFDGLNIPVYDDFKYKCTVENALLKLETAYVPQNILDNMASYSSLVQQKFQSILESVDKHVLELHDYSSGYSSDASNLTGELPSGD